jgi:hypothetical protein
MNAALERLTVPADPRPVAQLGVSAAAAFNAFPPPGQIFTTL